MKNAWKYAKAHGGIPGRTILISTTVLCSMVAAPAWAQLAPPAPSLTDENGVDLATGLFIADLPSISIGQSENQLKGGERRVRSTEYVNRQYTIFPSSPSTGKTTVILDGSYYIFSVNSGIYTSTKNDGNALVETASGYIFTSRDGVVYTFYKTSSGGPGYIQTIQHPSGEKLTINGGTTTSNYGYQRHYFYTGTVQNERLVNLATDYCNLSGSCPVITGTWPTLKYSISTTLDSLQRPTTTYTTTDGSGRQTRLIQRLQTTSGPMISSTISRPGVSTSDSVIFTSTGFVSSTSIAGSTASYSWTPMGANGLQSLGSGSVDYSNKTVLPDGQFKFDGANTFTFDSHGRVDTVTAPGGSSSGGYSQYIYDARGNVTERVTKPRSGSLLPNIVEYAGYPAACTNIVTCNKPTWTKDGNGNQTDYSYDPTTGQVTMVVAPPSSSGIRPTTRFGYSWLQAFYKNASGAIVGSGQPISKLTSVSTCRTQASCAGTLDEVRTILDYGPQTAGIANNLLLVAKTQMLGDGSAAQTVRYAYDMLGRMTMEDGPLAGTDDATYYRYDDVGRVVGVIGPDPDGSGPAPRVATRTTYDAADNATLVEKGTVANSSDSAWAAFAGSEQLVSTYDSHGRKTSDAVKVSGVTHAIVQYSYNPGSGGKVECRAVRMNSALWSTLPASACTAQATGAAGPDQITRTLYASGHKIAQIQSGVGTADAANDVTYTYSNNLPSAVTDANGNVTSYGYDGFDRLLTTTFPGGSFERTDRDANGNVTLRRRRDGNTMSYTYDALGRLATKSFSNGEPTTTYGYDLLGNLTSVTGSQALTFAYDAMGRNLSQTSPLGTTSLQYDSGGRLSRTTWSDGFYVTYEYRNSSQLSAVRENGSLALANYAYDNLGRLTTLTRGNGTISSFGYDAISRLASIGDNLGGTAYDRSTTFTYKPSGQIASATQSNDAYAWTGSFNVDRSYGVNALNQYTSAGATTFGYDARGNLNASAGTTYAYSLENALTSASNGATLAYDPLLRLSQIGLSGLTTRFNYLGARLISEHNASGSLLRRYVYGLDEAPLVWYEGSGTGDRRWLSTDERGSVTAVTNSSGNAIVRNSYDEYGIPGSANSGRFQYTGQTWLSELGMYNYKARIYSPTLGRFMQTDPIGYEDGLNWYNYTGSDPINRVDPTGTAFTTTCRDVMSNPTSTEQGWAGTEIVISGGHVNRVCLVHWDPSDESGTYGFQPPKQSTYKSGLTAQRRNAKQCAVPAGGPGKRQLDANIREAERQRTMNYGAQWSIFAAPALEGGTGAWFVSQVKSGGPWDYKNQGYKNGQNFGNFNYGATAAALGYDWPTTMGAAHAYSLLDNGSLEAQSAMIKAGFMYAKRFCNK